MRHFDPSRSTTHDVVRQAIIPRSLQFRETRCFLVVVHRATELASLDFRGSDPYCIVSVQGPEEGLEKPWKGGGRTHVAHGQNPDVFQGDHLHFSVCDRDFLSSDDPLGKTSLSAESVWQGQQVLLELRGGAGGGGGGFLDVSVNVYMSAEKAREAKEASHVTTLHKLVTGASSLWRNASRGDGLS
eukprot:s5701_g6.t1